MFFVFIGGASASGKSAISADLLETLRQQNVSAQTLNMDDYFVERPLDIDPEVFRVTTNFDLPSMLDLALLQEHLRDLGSNKSITKPIFKFSSNRREGVEEIKPSDVVIIEGIFAQYFYKKYMSNNCNTLSVNVTTDSYNDTVDRRVQRDVLFREREKKVVLAQEHRYVGPGFFQYTATSSTGSDLYIHNTKQINAEKQRLEHDAAVKQILSALSAKKAAQNDSSSSSSSSSCIKPDVRELVAKSHLVAGTAMIEDKTFKGFFNGALGEFKGSFQCTFSEEEAQALRPK